MRLFKALGGAETTLAFKPWLTCSTCSLWFSLFSFDCSWVDSISVVVVEWCLRFMINAFLLLTFEPETAVERKVRRDDFSI
jgi:cellobiose-specific phosphotransferase system component IIC